MFPRLSKPVSQCYTLERFESLLSDAEVNASSDWDRSFTADLQSRFKTYGAGMHISTLQRHHLERIANQVEKRHARHPD